MHEHRKVQDIARRAMEVTRVSLKPGNTLVEIRRRCEQTLLELGADSFWYWGIGAFIFAGADTTASVSGRTYQTPDYVVSDNDILTIDLSPQINGIWGDYARTLIVENGTALDHAHQTSHAQWRAGVLAAHHLHTHLVDVADPSMTFDQLSHILNDRIEALGYENLDFRGNLGHSITHTMADRIYLEAGNHVRLDSVELFTFEPHICRRGGSVGFKHENIYRFKNGRPHAI